MLASPKGGVDPEAMARRSDAQKFRVELGIQSTQMLLCCLAKSPLRRMTKSSMLLPYHQLPPPAGEAQPLLLAVVIKLHHFNTCRNSERIVG